MLHTIENEDEDLDQFLSAETIADIYLESENVIQDTATLEEQNEDDQDEVDDNPGDIDDEEEDSYWSKSICMWKQNSSRICW